MAKLLTEKVFSMVDPATKRKLEKAAKRDQRSVGAVIRLAIRDYLAGQEA